MKSIQVLIVVFLGMSIGCMSCSYGGGPLVWGSPECRDYCQKTEGCCYSYPDCPEVPEDVMSECLCGCANMNRVATTEMIQGMYACANIPCEDDYEREACMDSLLYSCYGTSTPGVDAYCNRMEQCNPDITYEECVSYYRQIIGCYSTNTQAAMLTCASSGTCETFGAAFEQCMMDRLGIIDCNPEDL